MPSDADVAHNIPEKYIPNDNFLAWVNGRFPVDRWSDKLTNDKPNRFSAYYHYGSNPML